MKKTFSIFVLLLGYGCGLLFSEIPQKIIVGYNEPYPPYAFIEDNRRPTGIYPEIVDEAAKIVGIKVELKTLPWARVNQEAISGKIDAVMGLFKTSDREGPYEFLDEGFIYEEYSFFTLKGNKVKYSGKLEDLKNIKIGVVRGYKYGPDFDQALFLKREKCLTDQNVLEKLIKKRFVIAIGNKSVINYYANKLGVTGKIEWLTPPVSKDFSHIIAFSKAKGKQSEELARKFSDAIKQLIKNGMFKTILEKYKFDNKEYSKAKLYTVKLVYNDWSPYYGPGMPNNGPIAEIITQAFDRVGYKTKSEYLPWKNLMEKLKTGKYDAGFAAYYSEERAKEYIFSEPIGLCSRVAFLKKKTTQVNFKKLDDLKPYRIGITRGYIYAIPEFDDAGYLKKIESASEEASIMNLIKGRLDLVIIDKAVAHYLIDKNFNDRKNELDFLEFTDRKGKLYLFISKKSEMSGQLKKDFDYGLKQIKKDGTFDRIIKEYEEKYGYSYETNKK